MSEFNATSSFIIEFNNKNGQYDNNFSLNEDVEIWADKDSSPATTKIFLGIIEKIEFKGKSQKETIILSGRDYGAILQDIIVRPRIFKNEEVSDIVEALIIQNATSTGLTITNVNSTGEIVEKITFNNISLFDAIKQLGEISGYYFYVDTNKDLNFIQRNSTSSGLTFDNTNITNANFKQSDSDISNRITVYGDRQLTGVREIFSAQAGSVYVLDDKPYNVGVIGSGTTNVQLQPGGILNISDPEHDDIQFLVDFQASQIILPSGTTAGDNTGWTGSIAVIIDYQRSSPLISIKENFASQVIYGQKDKTIIDVNIKSQEEAALKANTFLAEHKDPVTQGKLTISGVVNVTPGNTAVVDIPFHGINSQTYMILNANYIFNSTNNQTNQVLQISVNKKIRDFIDYMRDQEIRLRNLEGAEIDASITNVELTTGSVVVESSYVAVSTSIGSAFYFHVPNHNILNSPSSLLGDMRAGSIVETG